MVCISKVVAYCKVVAYSCNNMVRNGTKLDKCHNVNNLLRVWARRFGLTQLQKSRIFIPFCLEMKLHEYLFYCPKTR